MTQRQMNSPTPARCTVVVTTWKRPVLLAQTLESLLVQTYPLTDIVVICDGDDADVRAVSRRFSSEQRIRWVFHPENRGLPAARNTGAREASGEIVLFCDDDVIADPQLVALHMQHHNQVGEYRRIWVGGRIVENPDRELTTYLNRRLHTSWSQVLDRAVDRFTNQNYDKVGDEIEQSVWCGLNCSISKEIFLSLGGYDERLRASDEEMELGQRLYRAGLELVFESRATLLHMNSKDLTEYHRHGWRATGALDTYRVFELNQRVPQTQHLGSMFHGPVAGRMASRLSWHFSGPMATLAGKVETAANRTQWSPLFGLWARTCRSSEYWNAAKAAGCTLDKLKAVAGPAKCALMLHSVAVPQSSDEATYYIAPDRFHRFMRWFHRAGYRTASLEQWLRDEVPEKHVLLTFDDGYDDLYQELLPLVVRHHYRPLIFLVADRIGQSSLWDQASGLRARNLLTLDQIREMQRCGVDFGSHTLTHPWLPDVPDAQLRREVRDSKHRLEDLLGVEITSFAYPYGGVDMRVRSAVAEAGYKVAFTIKSGLNWWNDPLCQRRADVNDYTSLVDFLSQLRNGWTLRESLTSELRSLEQNLPTSTLRGTVRGVRRLGHLTWNRVSRQRRERAGNR